METIFIYLIKSSALIGMFFLVHHFLLRKETFFTTNRWFLLIGLVISVVAPLLFIKKIVYVEPVVVDIEELVASSQTMSNVPQKTAELLEINWFEIGFWVYGIVVLLLLLKVMHNSFSLYKTLKNKPILKQEQFLLVDVEDDVAPFSFFNFIVYNSKLYSDSELNSILTHEKIHSAQKHSVDVLITKLFSIIFWFNPFMQWYKKAIVQNLEYIADQKAIECIQDKKSYQLTLLKVVSHQNCLPITNHFYQSLIKKRIVMLNTNQSHKRNAWKYAVVLPLLIAFVFLFQVKTVAQEIRTTTTTKSSQEKVYITTDKNTSDAEMKRDAQLAKEKYGVTLKYSKVKRNAQGEITGIKVTFKDKDGNTGTTEYDGKEPIKPIHFYKTPTKIGFGNNNNVVVYSKHNNEEEIAEEEIEIEMNGTIDLDLDLEIDTDVDVVKSGSNESKIVIQKDGKKPLIIINGEVIEGGEGYSENEIKEFKKGYTYQFDGDKLKMLANIDVDKISAEANADALAQLKKLRPEIMLQVREQMKNSREQMQQARQEMIQSRSKLELSKPDLEKARADMELAREEMMRAKADMERAKAELEKAKEELKR